MPSAQLSHRFLVAQLALFGGSILCISPCHFLRPHALNMVIEIWQILGNIALAQV